MSHTWTSSGMFGCGADQLHPATVQSEHYALPSLPPHAAFLELSHPPFRNHESGGDDQLVTMFWRMCGSIDEGKVQHHAMVRWGDLHQRITSRELRLTLPQTPRNPETESLISESSATSLPVEEACGASVVPVDDEAAPTSSKASQFRLTDSGITLTIMRALQGSLTACVMLLSGQLNSQRVRSLAMHNLLQPLATAGLLRSRLRTFVDHFTMQVQKCSDVDVTQTAFAVAVGAVLHMHTVQLHTCVESIWDRRAGETNAEDMDADVSDEPTPHEILHHTAAIRNQVLRFS